MTVTEQVLRWVSETARLIVEHPDAVRVELLGVNESIAIRLWANPSDVGKLIGKQGRNAKSFRILGTAIAMVDGKRFDLDIPNAGNP